MNKQKTLITHLIATAHTSWAPALFVFWTKQICRGKKVATYQKTIQEKKLDVKELRKQAEHYNSILYQTNGATLSGEVSLFWLKCHFHR